MVPCLYGICCVISHWDYCWRSCSHNNEVIFERGIEMTTKTVIVNDYTVYQALRNQARLNRRFAFLILVGVVCIVSLKSTCDRLTKKIEELTNVEGE